MPAPEALLFAPEGGPGGPPIDDAMPRTVHAPGLRLQGFQEESLPGRQQTERLTGRPKPVSQ